MKFINNLVGAILFGLGYSTVYLCSLIGLLWSVFEVVAAYQVGVSTLTLVATLLGWWIGVGLAALAIGLVLLFAGSVLLGKRRTV